MPLVAATRNYSTCKQKPIAEHAKPGALETQQFSAGLLLTIFLQISVEFLMMKEYNIYKSKSNRVNITTSTIRRRATEEYNYVTAL